MLKVPRFFSVRPVILWLLAIVPAWAGGGPENVFLVVNSADMASLTIANHFVSVRKIPTSCVFEINWPDAPMKTDIDTFRERMLSPILSEIKRRKLTRQIDYIIYSDGFPFAADFSSDVGSTNDKFTVAAVTSLTFLHELVMEGNAAYKEAVNHYARNVLSNASGESRGFRSQIGIDPMGNRVQPGISSPRYYLSMMLGSTRGTENNSLGEVLRYLTRGAKADGSKPDGTIYFVKNDDIRSQVRHDRFSEVVDELVELGVNAEVVEGRNTAKECLPVGKNDVAGAMVGFYKYSVPASGCKILPGAICENFTSWGGDLTGSHTKMQTLLCDFLRFGAVASSGTVTEPYAIHAKFPHPRMHLHYARGCSVAEAYYQSVLSPYQLVIVGDPLCQPWAVAPSVEITGLDRKRPLSGTQEIQVSAKSATGYSIRNFDVFIDGVLLLRALPGKAIKLDTTKLANGYHELRVVAVEESKIETQGRAFASFVSMNHTGDEAGRLTGVTGEVQRKGGVIYVKIQSRGARELRLYKGRQLIGSMPGETALIRCSSQELGVGKSTLTPVAVPKVSGDKPVFGFPIEVKVGLGR